MTPSNRRFPTWLGAAYAATALAACAPDSEPVGPIITAGSAVMLAEIEGGSTVAAVVRLGRPYGDEVAGLQGKLHFDPASVRYMGQLVGDRSLLAVGESEASNGTLRFVVLDRAGVGADAATLLFERLTPAAEPRLSLELTRAASLDSRPVPRLVRTVAATPTVGRIPPGFRHMTAESWLAELRTRMPPQQSGRRPELVPGQGTVFGDVDLSGVLDLFDVISEMLVAANAQPLLDVAGDVAIAGDVFPANSPGLGDANDPVPPGLEANGSRLIDLFDALAIASFVAGLPDPIVGQSIPGRTPVTNRAILSGLITVDRTLARDTIYELDGMVIVTNSAVLTIPAGTRLEGNTASRGALSIRRGSQLVINGTRLEPVVMTCTSAAKTPGCWGGLQINGVASVNNGNVGAGGTIQCPELAAPGGFGIYGGCLDESSSGAIRYLRIEYAGAPAGTTPMAALQLLGVGALTILANIQVHRAGGDAVLVSGGVSQLRQVVLTDNTGIALDWNDGWRGKAQEVVIHRGTRSGIGIRGSNAPPGVTIYGQRSSPMLYNLTLIGPTSAGAGAPALLLHRGTGGLLRDVLVQGFDGPGLQINDSETCMVVTNNQLSVGRGVFFQNQPDFSTDADCIDEVAYAQDPTQMIQVADPQLLAPNIAASPDFRPRFGSPAENGVAPPADGFFNPNVSHIGAVAPANLIQSNIPWYAGWIVGW